jgi:hypothetical protein
MAEEIDHGVFELARQIRQAERQQTLTQLLTLCFGALPAAARSRIEGADDERLARWFEQLKTAETLEQALAE